MLIAQQPPRDGFNGKSTNSMGAYRRMGPFVENKTAFTDHYEAVTSASSTSRKNLHRQVKLRTKKMRVENELICLL